MAKRTGVAVFPWHIGSVLIGVARAAVAAAMVVEVAAAVVMAFV